MVLEFIVHSVHLGIISIQEINFAINAQMQYGIVISVSIFLPVLKYNAPYALINSC